MSLESKAIAQQKRLWKLWSEELRNDFPLGFEMATSPILDDPKIVIIGRNAGVGSDQDLESTHSHMERFDSPEQDFGFYEEHDYKPGGASYPIARRMRNIVFNGRHDLLDKTIETNRDFLRTDGYRSLKRKLDGLRDDGREHLVNQYNTICQDTITEFIEYGEPMVVISFTGYSDNKKYPFEELREYYGFDGEILEQYRITRDMRNKNGTIISNEFRLTHADIGDFRFIGITPHLSTPNIPRPVRELMIEHIPSNLPN